MKHGEFKNKMLLALSREGFRVFNNPVGYDQARRITYGLTKGSADLVGWSSVGRFCGFEIKVGKDRVRKDQRAWLSALNKSGGFGIVIHASASNIDAAEAARGIERVCSAADETMRSSTHHAGGVSFRFIT